MATYTVEQAPAVWKARASELKRAASSSVSSAALFMRNTARSFAPVKSGKLIMGINAFPNKNGGSGSEWIVESIAKRGTFPYNMWVNKSAPYIRIHPWWNQFKPTVYGDGSHTITGSPGGYWTQAKIQTTKVFGRIARDNVRQIFKGLKVRLT